MPAASLLCVAESRVNSHVRQQSTKVQALCYNCVLYTVGTPCSLKDGSCLTDRKATNNEEFGTTLILSIDDEPINHMVIEECIAGTGYKVHLIPSALYACIPLALFCNYFACASRVSSSAVSTHSQSKVQVIVCKRVCICLAKHGLQHNLRALWY